MYTVLKKEFCIDNQAQNSITFDINYVENNNAKGTIIFLHGFKGFKDWGAYNLIAQEFAKLGYTFIKLNFSHNGVASNNLTDITDLELFKKNTIEKEINDIDILIKYIKNTVTKDQFYINLDQLFLMGHSRGGATALIASEQLKIFKKLILLAPVTNLNTFFNKFDLEKWFADGILNLENSRLNIKMPVSYQLYENYMLNISSFDLEIILQNTDKEILILHGNKDNVIAISESKHAILQNPQSILIELSNADHTFGISHPYESNTLNQNWKQIIEETIEFISY